MSKTNPFLQDTVIDPVEVEEEVIQDVQTAEEKDANGCIIGKEQWDGTKCVSIDESIEVVDGEETSVEITQTSLDCDPETQKWNEELKICEAIDTKTGCVIGKETWNPDTETCDPIISLTTGEGIPEELEESVAIDKEFSGLTPSLQDFINQHKIDDLNYQHLNKNIQETLKTIREKVL